MASRIATSSHEERWPYVSYGHLRQHPLPPYFWLYAVLSGFRVMNTAKPLSGVMQCSCSENLILESGMWFVLNWMSLPVWAKKGIFCVLPRGSRFTTPSSTVNVSFTLCPYTADLSRRFAGTAATVYATPACRKMRKNHPLPPYFCIKSEYIEIRHLQWARSKNYPWILQVFTDSSLWFYGKFVSKC